MPAIHRTLLVAARHRSPRLLRPWAPAPRRLISSSRFRAQRDSQIWRPDFTTTGYSNSYEVGAPTVGPLAQAAKHGAPRLTPSALKEHLDKFVVGQDRAKKVTSVAIYNHYQRIREIQRQDDEEVERRAQEERRLLAERERDSHPVESIFPSLILISPDSYLISRSISTLRMYTNLYQMSSPVTLIL
jgi:ATP-dependent Clp protease ATP-binding subunit ClpX